MKLKTATPVREVRIPLKLESDDPLGSDAYVVTDSLYEGLPFLCVEQLHNYVALPRGTKKIDVVYSNTPHRYSFELNMRGDIVPLQHLWLYPACWRLNQRMYRRGLRYVRIEY